MSRVSFPVRVSPAKIDSATAPTAAGTRTPNATRLGILFTEDPGRFLEPVRQPRRRVHVVLLGDEIDPLVLHGAQTRPAGPLLIAGLAIMRDQDDLRVARHHRLPVD